MSDKFRIWRTDIEDEAVTHEVEAHNAYEAARKFAEQEFARDAFASIVFEIEDSFGQQFEARADVEMEPTFDVGCVRKKAALTTMTRDTGAEAEAPREVAGREPVTGGEGRTVPLPPGAVTAYNPQRAAALVREAKRRIAEVGCWLPLSDGAIQWLRREGLSDLADQLEAAGREVAFGLERIENLHGDVSKVRDLYEQATTERDTLRAQLDHQTIEYQRAIERLRADLVTSGNARTEATTPDPGDTARFPRTVTCVWCRNRYRSACPSELDRGLQGSHCASCVVQRGGAWFIHCGYGSDEHDMHTYRFVANPPSEPADPVCDECISQRLLIGDIEDTGLESERRPSDFGPRPFGTGGLVYSIRKLTEDMVPLRSLAAATDAYVRAGGAAEISLQMAVHEYRKHQRWTGEIDDGDEEYAEGCPEVAAQMRDAAAHLERLAQFWESKRGTQGDPNADR